MSFFLSHIERIIADYQGNPPLSVYLKAYFRQYPKLGSRDRKALSEAAYIYYRCCRFAPLDTPVMEVIAAGIHWCRSGNAFLKKMIEFVHQEKTIEALPPEHFKGLISETLSAEEWLYSLWRQPQLFIRMRKQGDKIIALLEQQQVPFERISIPGNSSQDCLRIANGSSIDSLLPEQDYVVQDWSSQASIYALLQTLPQAPASVWDVCSGAGGKSILLKDKLPAFALLATDVRESILHNLRLRFKLYGLGKVDTMALNSTDELAMTKLVKNRKFDLVLCDVPCSGSGTWARTPEQFHFFEEKNLEQFEALQYPIAYNASRHVAEGGTLAYITCSVFRRENEAVVQRLQQTTGLQLVHQELIVGLDQQADALFLAVFRK